MENGHKKTAWNFISRLFRLYTKPRKSRFFAITKTVFFDIINIRKAVFFMMTRNADKKREQMLMLRMDDMFTN